MAAKPDALDRIYEDPRFNDRPVYPAGDVARSLNLSPSTLRWWTRGRDHYRPVIFAR
jgi:hypothetical protein